MTPDNSDAVAGGVAAAAGSAGLTIQMLTSYANLGATVLNILLALGGLYLLWHRIKKARRDSRK